MQAGNRRRSGKRVQSPDKWEINQLIKAGVLDITEYPTFDAEDGHGILNMDDDVEEEFEIDINDVCTYAFFTLLVLSALIPVILLYHVEIGLTVAGLEMLRAYSNTVLCLMRSLQEETILRSFVAGCPSCQVLVLLVRHLDTRWRLH